MLETKNTPSRPKRLPLYIPVILIVLTFLAYSNTFRAPFIFDDGPSIVENKDIRNLSNIGAILHPDLLGGVTTAGRPVVNLSLAVNYAISGENTWSYHVVNLIIHILAGLVLLGLIRRTLMLPSINEKFRAALLPFSAVAAALWLLHPLQTESVTYIVQRAESIASLFYLLTLYCFVRSVSSNKTSAGRKWLAASVVACLVGVASKEIVVSVPLVVFLYDRTFAAGTFKEAWKSRKYYYLSLIASWILLALLVISTRGRGGTVTFEHELTPWYYLLTQSKAIMHYIGLTMWPADLALDYGVLAVGSLAQVWMQSLTLIILFLLSLYGLKRQPVAGFLGISFFAILSPTSSFIPIASQTIAEHRMYLALAAIICLIMITAYRLFGARCLWVFGLLAIVAGCATYQRNYDYRSSVAIWEDTARKLPMNARARNNYGQTLYVDAKDTDGAIAEYKEAIKANPKFYEAYYNLGVAGAKKGLYEEAILCYQKALKLHENYPQANNNYGNALRELGRMEEAKPHYLKAIEQDPGFAEPYSNLGNILQEEGDISAAIAYFQKAIRINPDYAEAQCNWGNALAQQNRMEEAITHYKECLRIQPDYTPALNNLGSALIELNRLPEAGEAFAAALRIKPDMLEASRNLAYVYVHTGRPAEALAIYYDLLRAMPGEQGLRDEIARLEALLKR